MSVDYLPFVVNLGKDLGAVPGCSGLDGAVRVQSCGKEIIEQDGGIAMNMDKRVDEFHNIEVYLVFSLIVFKQGLYLGIWLISHCWISAANCCRTVPNP